MKLDELMGAPEGLARLLELKDPNMEVMEGFENKSDAGTTATVVLITDT